MMASEGDITEIALGKLAGKQSANPKVREFGMHMIDNHMQTTEELGKLAKKLGFKVSTEMSKKHQEIHDKLANIKGADFDRAYIMGQIKAHENAVSLFTAKPRPARTPS